MSYIPPDRTKDPCEDRCIPLILLKILRKLTTTNKRLKTMSETIELLTSRVESIESVGDSAIALLEGLKAQLDEAIASNDMGAVQALSDRIAAQSDELAAAVAANTPADGIPVDPPTV